MKLETPIKDYPSGCLACCIVSDILPLDYPISVGFGDAWLEVDGFRIWSEAEDTEYPMLVSCAEDIAKDAAEGDWRIHLVGPLSDKHYQRQGENLWVLYEKGEGFA